MGEKKKHIFDLIVLSMLCLVIKGSYVFCNHSLFFYGDQIGTLALPAFLAGRDWTYIINNTPYYGFGYYWIFFVFFNLFKSYKVIYFMIILSNLIISLLVEILIYEICYYFIRRRGESVLISVISGSMYTFWVGVTNEHPLFFGIWVVVGLIVLCEKTNGKRKIVLSSVLAMVLSFLVLVHERSLALLLAVFMTTLALSINKCIVVEPISFSTTLAIGFLGGRLLRNFYIRSIFRQGSLSNTSVVNVEAANNFNVYDIKGMIVCFITNMYKTLLTSYGLIVFSIILLCIILKILLKKSKDEKNMMLIKRNKGLIMIFLSFIFALVITVAGLAYGQGGYLNYALSSKVDSQSYKSLFYIRYYEIYLGPIFMTTYILWNKIRVYTNIKIKNIYFYIIILYLIVVSRILNPVWNSSYGLRHLDFSPIYTDFLCDNNMGYHFNAGISLFVLLLFVGLMNSKNKKIITISLVLMILLIPQNYQGFSFPSVKTDYDKFYEVLTSIERDKLPNEIYVDGVNRNTVQFVLNDYEIKQFDKEWTKEDSGILLSGNNLGDLENSIHLNMDEQHIYVKGKQLQDEVLEAWETYIVENERTKGDYIQF